MQLHKNNTDMDNLAVFFWIIRKDGYQFFLFI